MGAGHPECPDRVDYIDERLRITGLVDLVEEVEPPRVTREQLLEAHGSAHVDHLYRVAPSEGHVWIDADTMMMPSTLEAAEFAAGAGIGAVDGILGGRFERAFCNVRPPGHHATRDQAMGFCFFNNIALAVRHALNVGRLKRVMLFDFDVHHGNGSEDILAGDPRVRMLGTFQTRLYPFSGEVPAADNIVSVPLKPYSHGPAMREAVTRCWLPVIDAFEPEMIFISAGFDAHRDDELGQLGWVDADYAWVTRLIVEAANRHAGGRIVSMLEGGYDLRALARSAEQHVRELLEVNSIVFDEPATGSSAS